jgi:hypothetical protein
MKELTGYLLTKIERLPDSNAIESMQSLNEEGKAFSLGFNQGVFDVCMDVLCYLHGDEWAIDKVTRKNK